MVLPNFTAVNVFLWLERTRAGWSLSRLTMLDNPHEVIRPWLPIATVRDWLPPRRKAMTPAVVELASVLGDLSENAEELEIDATDIREALLSLSASPSFAERNAALRAIARSPSWLTADQRDDLWHRNGKSTFTTEQTLAVAILMREYGSQWKHFDEAVDEWSRSESWQVRRQVAAEAYARQLHAPAESPPLVDQVLKTLQGDSNSLVRAAAITQPRAEELLANPEIETSWGVLEMAARVAKVNLEALEPDLPEAPAKRSTPSRFHCSPKEHGPCVSFPLDEPTMVSRIGISGHYGLPPKGYAKAAAEGVNLFFWEPGYSSMTAFCQGIAGHVREQLHFIGGTFKANSKGVRDDVHRMLKHLKLDRVSLFLLFWTRGWSRITDEVLATLDQLEASGDVARASISTHDRELACQAMRGDVELSRKRQWNPLMVRYSAAHRGAESEVFPLAIETGTTVVSFNNLCYGRLLLPLPGKTELPRIDAVDCYRFALSHPAVAVSLSAPATLAQLDENLAALHDPTLPEERRQRLLQHGASIYEQDRLFQRCVRSR